MRSARRSELNKLANNPDRRDIDVVQLQGRAGFRLRVGNWRIILSEMKRDVKLMYCL